MLYFCLLSSALIALGSSATYQNASVTYDSMTKQFSLHPYIADNHVANATFLDEIFVTGWSYLEVKSNETYPDAFQAYAAGLVEGFVTQDLLKKTWNNLAADYCKNEATYCKTLKNFLQKNLDFIKFNIEDKRQNDTYWHQVALTLEQLSGLEDGYQNVTKHPRTDVDVMGLMLLNLLGDLEDLETPLKIQVAKKAPGSGSCSALIKVLPNNRDLYFSHATWTTYSSMLRILKKYSLKFHINMETGSPIIPGHTMTFSSQPGFIGSQDDFYVISSGLATMETTIGNDNSSLWQYVTPEGTVLEWQRNIVANRLAKNGRQWAKLFAIMNSGTYNNQWMILDYKLFQSGEPLQNNLLWVLEQLPGYIRSEDVTDVLRNQSYWPSYNVAFYEDVFNLSEAQVKDKNSGDWYTYNRTPRALIFKRDQGKVHDIPSMIHLMRYNNYTKDPLSKCNCTPPYSAVNAISARSDLNPANGTYPFEALGHSYVGAIDMKLTTSKLYKNLDFVAFSGPTYDPLPPFQWSKTDSNNTVPHLGQPDLWNFKPIIHRWL